MLQQLVEKEVAAESPPLNKISWPDYWTSYFIYLRKNQENPEKYIAFILDLRRRASLHDLPKN